MERTTKTVEQLVREVLNNLSYQEILGMAYDKLTTDYWDDIDQFEDDWKTFKEKNND